MSEFIRAEHLSFSYGEDKQIPALRDLSLSVKEGEYVAVLGHNGSGKSTFAKLCNGILTPTGGKLTVGGIDLALPNGDTPDDETLFRLRQQVGMVFQNPDNQMVANLVEEDVAFGLENLGVPYDEMHKRVEEALTAVGMRDYARHSPSRLSGGQKQRVAIAGILAMMPKCMILDEFTAMLDPIGREEVLSTVEKLHRERGITLLHITHYMNEAARADRIVVIHDGELLLDGTPAEVFSDVKLLHSIGLEAPQETELLYALSKEGIELPHGVLGVDACAQVLVTCVKGGREE